MSDSSSNVHKHPQLTAEQQQDVFNRLQGIFHHLAYFDQLVAPQLRQFISDSNTTEISMRTTYKVEERYFVTSNFVTLEQRAILKEIKVVFRAASTLIISLYPENRTEMYADVNQLLDNYSQFRDEHLPADELQYLLQFRNYMHTALKIIPARMNKALLLTIAARLEGSDREYNTGSRQTPSTTRRVQIYEQEGNTTAQPQAQRNNNSNGDSTTASKRQRLSKQSERATQLRRLPSDNVRNFIRGTRMVGSFAVPAAPPAQLTSTSSLSPQPPNPQTMPTAVVQSNEMFSLGVEDTLASHSAQQQQDIAILLPPLPQPFSSMNPSYWSSGTMPSASSPFAWNATANAFDSCRNNISNNNDDMESPLTPRLSEVFSFGSEDLQVYDTLGAGQNDGAFLLPPPSSLPTQLPVVGDNSRSSGAASSTFSWNGNGNAFNSNSDHNNSNNIGAPLAVQLSHTFPPTISREASEALDNLLLEGVVRNTGENETGASLPQTMHATDENTADLNSVELFRAISWDIYNGSFSEEWMNDYLNR